MVELLQTLGRGLAARPQDGAGEHRAKGHSPLNPQVFTVVEWVRL
jgi:hypothetical protein